MTDGAASTQETVGQAREREADVLYGLVLLFTYGQLALIVWDLLVLIPGFSGLTGLRDPGRVHPIGEMTSAYLGLLGIYVGRNALRRYRNKEDAQKLPHYVFLGMQRGYFYLALWGVLCFVAYMLKALTLIPRMPCELVLTTSGVLAALFGDKAIKGFLDRRTVRQLEQADTSSGSRDLIMEYVDKNARITNQECRELTGLKESQATFVLGQLEKEGKLEQAGSGRGAYYRKK